MSIQTTERTERSVGRKIPVSAVCRALIAGLLVCAFGAHRDKKAAGAPAIAFHGTPALAGQPIPADRYNGAGDDIASHANRFHIAATTAGDGWNYTLTIPATGSYVFSARASAPTYGATFHAEFDGANLTGPLGVPNSSAWTHWNTVASRPFTLTAGTHVMRIVLDTNVNASNSAGAFDVFNVTPVLNPDPIHWTAVTPSPEKRFEGYTIAYHGKLFTLGGYNSLVHPYSVNPTASVYDCAADHWTSLGEIPVAPTHAGFAQDAEHGILYFAGGLQGAYPGVTTTEAWSYDLNTNSWTPLPPLPIPVAAGTAVLVNYNLHYFAGIGPDDRNTNIPVHFVLTLGSAAWRTAAPLPIPRDHVTAIAFNGKIFAFGGEIGHDAFHMQQTQSHVYDPDTNIWTPLADMPLSKSHTESSVFVSQGKIIIAGGQIDNYAATNTILQYNPATNTWSLLGNLPASLQGEMLQPINNHLVLTNGYDGTHMNTQTWIADWNR